MLASSSYNLNLLKLLWHVSDGIWQFATFTSKDPVVTWSFSSKFEKHAGFCCASGDLNTMLSFKSKISFLYPKRQWDWWACTLSHQSQHSARPQQCPELLEQLHSLLPLARCLLRFKASSESHCAEPLQWRIGWLYIPTHRESELSKISSPF